MVLHCRLSSEGLKRRIKAKMEPLVHRKQLRKTNIIINFLPMQTV
jgi:hypothetical protein